jgi:hypothetical protein
MLKEDMNRRRRAWEFERRFNVVGLLVLFGALPVFSYVGIAYALCDFFYAPAFGVALCSYLFFGFAAAAVARRAINSALDHELASTPGTATTAPEMRDP